MKKITKICLSVLLTAAIVCSLLTPAFGWIIPFSRLRTPNSGACWVDLVPYYNGQWMQVSDFVPTVIVTLYSRDGIVWYTAQGLAEYEGITGTPGQEWQTRDLSGTLQSPDGGKMWLIPEPSAWTDWIDYWDNFTVTPEPEYVYSETGSFLLRTEPFDGYERMIPIYEFGIDRTSGMSEYSFNVQTQAFSHVLLSTDGIQWKTTITDAEWRNSQYNPSIGSDNPYLYPCVSYDPQSGRITRMSTMNGVQFDFLPDDSATNSYFHEHRLYLRAMEDCTVRLEMNYNAPDYVYCMMDLNMIALDRYVNVSPNSIGPDPYPDPFVPNGGRLIQNKRQAYYTPLTAFSQPAWAEDFNANGIIETTDTLSSPDLLAAGTVYPYQEAIVTIRMQANETFCLPICVWAEGQSPYAIGSVCPQNSYFNLNVSSVADGETYLYPITYKENDDDNGVTVTGFDPDYFYCFTNDTPADMSGYGVVFDPGQHTLTIPDTIGGKPVTAIGNHALNSITTSYCMTPYYADVRQIILPNTVQSIGQEQFGDTLQRVHVPYGAVPSAYAFVYCSDYLTVCCDQSNSMTQQTLENAGTQRNFTFLTCTEHGISHTHTFGKWETTVAATCTAGGEQTRVCTACGAVQTETVAALGHDFCAWQALDKHSHYRTCARCGTGESGTHEDSGVLTEPTCTTDGYTTYTCALCGYETVDKPTSALGHDYDAVVTEPTCTEGGLTTYTCKRCGDTYTADETDAIGHAFGDWEVTTAATLTADGVETRTCSRCGETETRAIPTIVTNATLTVGSGVVHPGETVQVTVSMSDNPGITAAMLQLQYDPQVLTLTAVENGTVFGADVFQPGGDLSAVPFTLFWVDPLAEENNTANGTLATFTFTAAADAPLGTTAVTITYDADSTFDKDLQSAAFNTENGTIRVTPRMPGDNDGDGVLDLKDVAVLIRYLAGGWDVTADLSNADVDGDGKVTLKDVTLLRRYLAGWDVTLA